MANDKTVLPPYPHPTRSLFSGGGYFRWLLAVSVLLCALTSLVHAEKLPYSLLGGAITYTFPKRWSLQKVSQSQKMEALQFVITLSAPGEPLLTTNAILIAEPNTENLTIADISTKKISKTYKPVADYPEGDSWRTVLSQVPDSKPPYTVFDRFGVTAKVRVHLRIVLPTESDATAKWPSTLAKDSNEVINKLGINLHNAVGVELHYTDGKWELFQSQTVKQNVLQRPAPPPPKPPVPTSPSDQLFTPPPDGKSAPPS